MDAHVISLANQKGGTAKTTTCANLGIGLAQAGRKVLLVDADAQGSLTLSLGWEPDELPITLYDLMIKPYRIDLSPMEKGCFITRKGWISCLPTSSWQAWRCR